MNRWITLGLAASAASLAYLFVFAPSADGPERLYASAETLMALGEPSGASVRDIEEACSRKALGSASKGLPSLSEATEARLEAMAACMVDSAGDYPSGALSSSVFASIAAWRDASPTPDPASEQALREFEASSSAGLVRSVEQAKALSVAAASSCSGFGALRCSLLGNPAWRLASVSEIDEAASDARSRVAFAAWKARHPKEHRQWLSKIDAGEAVPHPFYSSGSQP